MPRNVETFRTTKALRELVRRAAKVAGMRPSEFLRRAIEEKARVVLREAAGQNLRKVMARLPPGRVASEAEAGRLGEVAARAARKGTTQGSSSAGWRRVATLPKPF